MRRFFSTSNCWKRSDYLRDVERASSNPDSFWNERAKQISWFEYPKHISPSSSNKSWFEGGILNTSYLCLDKHVEDGRGGCSAVVFESLVQEGKNEELSYKQLLQEVNKIALSLKQLGVKKGV